jgi:hypothetical protein
VQLAVQQNAQGALSSRSENMPRVAQSENSWC